MIRHIDWDGARHRDVTYELPASVGAIAIELDGGRVKVTINGAEVFCELDDGTRNCLIQIDRAPAVSHDWAVGSGPA